MISFTILTLFIGLVAANASPLNATEPVTDEAVNSRIYNGTKAADYEFPYVLRFTIKRGNTTVICSGSMIADYYALTAAQCFHPIKEVTSVLLQVGRTDINAMTYGAYYRNFTGNKNIIMHPNYNTKTRQNDIALFKTSEPFLNNKATRKIKIASKHAATGSCTLLGWGETSSGPSTVLRKATTLLVRGDDGLCTKKYKKSFEESTMLCAGKSNGGTKDACIGDFGGPLVLNGEQIGITSYTTGCNTDDPTVYTRLTVFKDWIERKTGVEL